MLPDLAHRLLTVCETWGRFPRKDHDFLCTAQGGCNLNRRTCTAGSGNDQFLPVNVKSVLQTVADPAGSIGDMSHQFSIFIYNGVDGTCQLCRFGKLITAGSRHRLSRHGNIAAAEIHYL